MRGYNNTKTIKFIIIFFELFKFNYYNNTTENEFLK